MKRLIPYLLVGAVCSMLCSSLSAQDFFDKKSSIQLNLGIARTFHFDPVIQFYPSFEGEYVTGQRARQAPQFHLQYVYKVGDTQSFTLAVGYSENRIQEEGFDFVGLPYMSIYRLRFFDLGIGHRLYIHSKGKLKPFWENSIMCHTMLAIPLPTDQFKSINFSLRTKAGFAWALNSKWALMLSGNFQTAFIRYNRYSLWDLPFPWLPVSEKNYFPYSYGFELGLMRGI